MLNNFDICINTRFIFGKGAEKQIGEILKKDGVKKVLITMIMVSISMIRDYFRLCAIS